MIRVYICIPRITPISGRACNRTAVARVLSALDRTRTQLCVCNRNGVPCSRWTFPRGTTPTCSGGAAVCRWWMAVEVEGLGDRAVLPPDEGLARRLFRYYRRRRGWGVGGSAQRWLSARRSHTFLSVARSSSSRARGQYGECEQERARCE